MGTNYYVVKKINDDNFINDINKIVKISSPFKLKNNIEKYIQNKCTIVHIGKSSGGWKFLFNHNDCKYYEKTRESIDKFIRNNILYDEYGKLIDPDEFWTFVDSKQNLLDNKTYYEKSKDDYYMFGNGDFYEEYSDDLRFSSSTEFS